MRFHRSTLKLVHLTASRLRRIVGKLKGPGHPLPPDFEPELYLELNPDVHASGADAAVHYSRFGYREGRRTDYDPLKMDGAHTFRSDHATIMIVSHEASRTGAPVLSLNLVQGLVGRYNVVAMLLGGGPLTAAFRAAGAAVITLPNLRGQPGQARIVIRQLCRRFKLRFAIINSIESRVVLPELTYQFVPTISLIHEFASYTRPRWAFSETFIWSSEVVFSATLTRDNAIDEYPDLGRRSTHILPQGQCLLPPLSRAEQEGESARLRRQLRPKGAEESLIILGAGSIQLRKGVDLFIDCAARIVRSGKGARCRFVWIGKGYEPEDDVAYSVYLTDQIRRAGLTDHVFFIDETSAIATAYEEADVLLLPSRLDPLPNVAIDALVHGVPVLCFAKTSGIADFLTAVGLQDRCVADYLDTAGMTEKLLALVHDRALRAQVAESCRTAATAYFKMERYIDQLEALAEQAIARSAQEKADVQVIRDSGLYRSDFARPLHSAADTAAEEVRLYVRSWATGISQRIPFPGFHPGIYVERHGIQAPYADPLADYLRAGCPDGPWRVSVITAADVQRIDLPADQRVALHLHVYYPDLLPELMQRLAYNQIRPALFISVTTEAARTEVLEELRSYRGKVAAVQVVQNRGRDIGPLLTAFGPRLISDYEFLGHLHTKKSLAVPDRETGRIWLRFLLENLLGSQSSPMADRILTALKQDAKLAMVFPDDPYVVGLVGNRPFAEALAQRMGLSALPESFAFPVGTMFWARTAALQPIMQLQLGWEDYPEEPLPYDGSIVHALERMFALSLPRAGLHYAVTNVNGVTR